MSDLVRDAIAASIAAQARLVLTPEPPYDYGVDLKCTDDLDSRLAEQGLDDVAAIGQDAYHRLTTTRGFIPDAPDFGLDVVSMLNRGMTPQDIAAAQGRIALELQKDDRVARAEVALTEVEPGSWDLQVRLTPEDPSLKAFDLVIAVVDGATLLAEISAAP